MFTETHGEMLKLFVKLKLHYTKIYYTSRNSDQRVELLALIQDSIHWNGALLHTLLGRLSFKPRKLWISKKELFKFTKLFTKFYRNTYRTRYIYGHVALRKKEVG